MPMNTTIVENHINETKNSLLLSYFQRIGFNGNAEPTLECLHSLHFLHPIAIPFENLNPFFGIPVLLDIDSVRKKLIDNMRGGYCFEHNLLFKEILELIGFKVKGLAARVIWNRPDDTVTPRSHMVLLVEADGQQFIADVGFGGQTLTAPLLLKPDLEQMTTHEPYRLILNNGFYVLQVLIKEDWRSVYKFTLEEQFLPDYEVTNWYLSNHPASHFVTGLIAARVIKDSRYNLRNTQLAVHYKDGKTEKTELTSVDEIVKVLQEIFLIRLPDQIDLSKLQKVIL